MALRVEVLREIYSSFLLTIAYMELCVEVGITHHGLRHHDSV